MIFLKIFESSKNVSFPDVFPLLTQSKRSPLRVPNKDKGFPIMATAGGSLKSRKS
jgi:hypothetical protein